MDQPVKTLDFNVKQDVNYCIPLWLRDEQIKLAIKRVKTRIAPSYEVRTDPVAIVCFGPSLNDTWEKVKDFKFVFSCSGSHKFLVERGIIPTWHVEVDPRAHKVKLIGSPHKDVEYLIASTCHPAVFDHLEGFKVTLWHVFDNHEDGLRTLPHGEWALTGGGGVGLRCMTIARFFGFKEQHIFGMDGSEGATGKHAAEHPMQPKDYSLVEYEGRQFKTTPAMLEIAKGTFHELNQMPDVKATFYGDGLVQHMAKSYKPKTTGGTTGLLGFTKPELVSSDYVQMNRQLHTANLAYGVGGGKHGPTVLQLAQSLKTTSVLDYGCGKGYLAKSLPFPIWEYDPAVPGKEDSPRAADIVVCTDVLEHIEPDKLDVVLLDILRCTRKIGYFVIHTGPSAKTLTDGRNSHLIQQGLDWWRTKLKRFFLIPENGLIFRNPLIYAVVGPKTKKNALDTMKASVAMAQTL